MRSALLPVSIFVSALLVSGALVFAATRPQFLLYGGDPIHRLNTRTGEIEICRRSASRDDYDEALRPDTASRTIYVCSSKF
ncbi:MAG TPA: hypothetical protein VF034_04690 [Gemmatimonadaceae bacterium]